jgi:2-dehydro-3-deoxy-D-pentonate aldolase
MNSFVRKTLRGIVPPMVTPLAGDDELDFAGLEKLIEHIIAGGVHGLFVLGTTGEGPALSYRLRRELIQATCRQVNRRIPVLVGIIDTARTEMLAMAKVAADAGADALVVAPPYYLPLSQNDLVRCVTSFAAESPLPIYLYNVPNLAHVRYTLTSLKICGDLPNVVGFKDSSGDFQFLEAALKLFQHRPDFGIFVGPENLLARSLGAGAHGAISGGANAFPRLYVALYDAAVDGRMDDVRVLQEQVEAFIRRVYSIGEAESGLLRGLKSCLSLMNICGNRLCWPYVSANSQEVEEIKRSIQALDQAHLLRAH